MDIEYEATFANIDKEEIRKRLKDAGAQLIKPEFVQKRFVFNMPKGLEDKEAWMRVRDEGDRVTLSYKKISGKAIDEQHETMLVIDNFDAGVEILEKLGCLGKAFQESKREIWNLMGVEITIDEWPFLEPYVEVEGKSEDEVKMVSEKMGFDYRKAIFDSVDYLYSQKYGISRDVVNNETPKIVFGGENPFMKLLN